MFGCFTSILLTSIRLNVGSIKLDVGSSNLTAGCWLHQVQCRFKQANCGFHQVKCWFNAVKSDRSLAKQAHPSRGKRPRRSQRGIWVGPPGAALGPWALSMVGRLKQPSFGFNFELRIFTFLAEVELDAPRCRRDLGGD